MFVNVDHPKAISRGDQRYSFIDAGQSNCHPGKKDNHGLLNLQYLTEIAASDKQFTFIVLFLEIVMFAV